MFFEGFITGILKWLYGLVKWWIVPPRSMVFTLILALILNIVSASFQKLLVDVDELRRSLKKVKEFNELKKKALLTKDKKLMAKVKKEEPAILKIQLEISKKQMMPTFILLPLILVFWWIFYPFFTAMPVVKLPFSVPFLSLFHGDHILSNDLLGFLGWYIIVSYSLYPFVQKLFRIPSLS